MKRFFKYLFLLLIVSNCTDDGQKDTVLNEKSKILDHKQKADLLKRIELNKKNFSTPTYSEKDKTNPDRKVRKYRKNQEKSLPVFTDMTRSDSSRFQKIKYLRQEQIEIDLNEPLSREFMLSSIQNAKFPSLIQLSHESFFRINFDNDILDYTDRFYTNGIRFDLISPLFHHSPLSKLLLPYWKRGINYYGISIVQNIYTPSTTKIDTILTGDRPYCSYLYFGSFKITNDPLTEFRQSCELDIGVIGSNAMGESVQKSFHSGVPPNSEPLGWEYQIKNDVLINYSVLMEKGVFMRKNLEFIGMGSGNLGSLYTNISGGFLLRSGLLNPYFKSVGPSKRQKNKEDGLKNTQFYLYLSGTGKLVGYDATLQGGVFNNTNAYYINSGDISRFTFQGTAGLSFTYSGFRIDLEQFLLSPEFHDGWWHKWVHIALTFAL